MQSTVIFLSLSLLITRQIALQIHLNISSPLWHMNAFVNQSSRCLGIRAIRCRRGRLRWRRWVWARIRNFKQNPLSFHIWNLKRSREALGNSSMPQPTLVLNQQFNTHSCDNLHLEGVEPASPRMFIASLAPWFCANFLGFPYYLSYTAEDSLPEARFRVVLDRSWPQTMEISCQFALMAFRSLATPEQAAPVYDFAPICCKRHY